ncbi:MAG: DnaB-like helicase C-terminal domain-containing protein, partial [Candidatus Phytoplasma australasiaticum]|nr:DnaB-like helicase C-terminal domain-containing protein [Candidatus Phytoplasma australasiaticum]
ADKLKKLNIYFDDSVAVNILDIRTQCRKLKHQWEVSMLVFWICIYFYNLFLFAT